MRKKKCKVCKETFQPQRQMQSVCSPSCAYKLAQKATERRNKKAQAQRKERLKTLSDFAKEAQVAVNRFIRARDYGHTCISCLKTPKKKNAGHYRSVGAMPALRFNVYNIHLQCEACNTHLSGNQIEYRINLAQKIGLSRLEWLEGPHKPKKYTVEQLVRIKKIFNKRARWYESRRGAS
jgi:hypothetical protein